MRLDNESGDICSPQFMDVRCEMIKNKFLILSMVILVCLVPLSACVTPGSNSSTLTTASTSQLQQPTSNLAQSGPASVVALPSFADMLNVVEHTVVEINTTGTTVNFFGRAIQQQGAGSGWIMDSSGTIITNNHVIEGADTITVKTLDGKTYPAAVQNADPTADLAVLKINANNLPTLPIGDASKLRVGDWVLAIGNPLGEGIIATQGIVSRLNVDLQISATESYNNLIETSAAINPGNSGGPLVNLSGEVVGITTVKVSQAGIEGMGYAINMTNALPVIQRLHTQ
jgi:serine protease Do